MNSLFYKCSYFKLKNFHSLFWQKLHASKISTCGLEFKFLKYILWECQIFPYTQHRYILNKTLMWNLLWRLILRKPNNLLRTFWYAFSRWLILHATVKECDLTYHRVAKEDIASTIVKPCLYIACLYKILKFCIQLELRKLYFKSGVLDISLYPQKYFNLDH